MPKRIANLLEDNSLYIAILLTILIAYLSLINIKLEIPNFKFGYFDKVAHITAYTSLSFTWFLSSLVSKSKRNHTLIIAIIIFIYGIIIEILQGTFTTYRTEDVFDVFANTIGIIIGYCIYLLWIKKRKLVK